MDCVEEWIHLNCRDYNNISSPEVFESTEHELYQQVKRFFAVDTCYELNDFDCAIEPMLSWKNDRAIETILVQANTPNLILNRNIIDWMQHQLEVLGYSYVRKNGGTLTHVRFKYS